MNKKYILRLGYNSVQIDNSGPVYFLFGPEKEDFVEKDMFVPSKDREFINLCLIIDAVKHLPFCCDVKVEYIEGKLDKLFEKYERPNGYYDFKLEDKEELVKYVQQECFFKGIKLSFRKLSNNEFLAPNGVLFQFNPDEKWP